MIAWILIAGLAIGGKPVHHKPIKPNTKVAWVCKGNSYMMLKWDFKPDKHKGCRKTKMQVDSGKP